MASVGCERCCLSYYHYIGRDPTATNKFTTGTFETLFPQNSNSKFGRGSAQILNLNFAAPAGPARTTFPRPGRKMFAARGGEHFVAGVRKSCGSGYLIAKGCLFSKLCIILYILLIFFIKKKNNKQKHTLLFIK